MKQRCIEQQTAPGIERGDMVSEGEFFRNLKREHVSKRFAGDDDKNPAYGFKLSNRHWKDADQQGQGLSVNLRTCIHSEACSIAMHPFAEGYFHVAVLDLGAMNVSGLLASPLVAQYAPVEDTRNRCHFEIMPLDGTVLPSMALRVLLGDPFPPGAKLPSTNDERSRAAAAYTQYRSYCEIRRWVRREDGKLTL